MVSTLKKDVKNYDVKTFPRKGNVVVDNRAIFQSSHRAMQGAYGILMAIIELVTNSHDSYIRLGHKDKKIVVSYQKKGKTKCRITVTDDAEGQSLDDIIKNFTRYWSLREIEDGDSQRGYFCKGAKDALGYMDEGEISSFKDERFVRCAVFFDDDKVMKYSILNDCKATPTLRKKYGIKGNGSVASFSVDSQSDKKIRIPQFNTLYEELSGHYLLREILKDDTNKVMLIEGASGKKNRRRLSYVEPKGKKIYEDEFDIQYKDYDTFHITMNVSRSDSPLSQKEKGDTRQGGLLIIDDKNVVLDLSLYKYDYDAIASKLYGVVQINGFRKLMQNGEIVLSPERDGLVNNHPFVESLIFELNKRLDIIVQKEKDLLKSFDFCTDKTHQKRHKTFCKVLNEIASSELKGVTDVIIKDDCNEEVPYPINGFYITPESVSVSPYSNSVLRLYIDTKKVSQGTVVELESTNPTIKITNRDSRIVVPPYKGKKSQKGKVVICYITISGTTPSEVGKIIAKAPDRTSSVNVCITDHDDIDKWGLAFQFDNIYVVPNKTRKIILFASKKAIKDGDEIILESDNPNIHINLDKIIVNESADKKRGVLKFELEIWGEGEGQEGTISAYCNSYSGWECENLMGVTIQYKKERNNNDKEHVFSPPEYRTEPNPPQPSSYSNEMEKVFIYTKFPVVSYYLGKDLENINSLPAQMYIANLIMNSYCHQLAIKTLNVSSLFSDRHKFDAIQRRKNELIEKYGTKLLNILIEQRSLKNALKGKK